MTRSYPLPRVVGAVHIIAGDEEVLIKAEAREDMDGWVALNPDEARSLARRLDAAAADAEVLGK